jgi:hypothetical protein
VNVAGEPWADVATPSGLRVARMRLLAWLARGRSDGFVTAHVTRRLSLGLTSRLAERDVSPNHVTVASFLAALAGAGFLAAGEYAWSVVGALLVLAAAVAEGCDGALFASYVTKEFALRHGREYPNDVLNRLRRRDLRLFGIGCGALLGVGFEAMVLLGVVSHLCAAGMLLRAWRRQGPFGYRPA